MIEEVQPVENAEICLGVRAGYSDQVLAGRCVTVALLAVSDGILYACFSNSEKCVVMLSKKAELERRAFIIVVTRQPRS